MTGERTTAGEGMVSVNPTATPARAKAPRHHKDRVKLVAERRHGELLGPRWELWLSLAASSDSPIA